MFHSRKLSLLLFILWAGLVISIVGVLLERTQRSLFELQGNRILKRLRELPMRILTPAPFRDGLTSIGEMSNTMVDKPFSANVVADSGGVSRHSISVAAQHRQISTITLPQRDSSLDSKWVCYRLLLSHKMENYRHFTLSDPTRWVLELPGRWQVMGEKSQKFSQGLIRGISLVEGKDCLKVVFWTATKLSPPNLIQEPDGLLIQFIKS